MEKFTENKDIKLLLVNVNKSLSSGIDPYDATRGIWKVDVKRARQADPVLGVSNGIVVSAFVPTRWKPATRTEFPRHPGKPEERFAFDGSPPTASVEAQYLNRLLPDRLAAKKGAANPVRYSW